MAREIIEVDGIKYTTCTKCGELKPIDQFRKKSASPIGLQSWCNQCADAAVRNSAPVMGDKLGLSNKPLGKCTPREILAELKSRGYVWDKMWVQTYVEYNKI